jgi:hypothetical protein
MYFSINDPFQILLYINAIKINASLKHQKTAQIQLRLELFSPK